MTSLSLRGHHDLLVAEGVPRWFALGLVIIGSISIMLALWSLLPPELYSERTRTTSMQEKENGVSPAPVADVVPARAVAAVADEHESAGASKPVVKTERVATGADSNIRQPSASTPASGQPEEESASQLAKTSGTSGFVRESACPPVFTVTFERNSTTAEVAEAMNQISLLSDWLDNHPQTKVVLEGHSDASGPEEYNLLLSFRRARAVATFLAEAGLPSDRLVVRAFGEQLPLTGRAATSPQNRRVSVRTEGSEQCPKPY